MTKEPAHLDAQSILKRRRYEELMEAGRTAFKEGNRRLAHDLWREAATVDPYNEQVWLMLFRVLDTDEDRIACLENIIAINPMNVQARRRLRIYQEHDVPEPPLFVQNRQPAAKAPKALARKQPRRKKAKAAKPARKPAADRRKKPRRNMWRSVLIVVLAIVLGLLLAVALSVIFAPPS